MATRQKLKDEFNAEVALEVPRGDKAVQQIVAKHQLHTFQVDNADVDELR